MDSLLQFASSQLAGAGQQGQQGNQQFNQQGGQQFNQQQGQQQQGFNQNEGQGQQQQQGGNQEFNQQGGNQQQQGGGFAPQQAGGFNLGALISGANEQHGNGDQISHLIQGALGNLQNVSPNASINESKVQQDHEQAYKQGNAGNMSANAMGSAAALQAFQSFLGGGGAQAQQSGGGSMIQKLIGMAMSEAVKLFDQSGGASNGTKQDVVSSAGETMMKLMVQNQIAGALGGGGGAAGGAGGGAQVTQLIGLASKFFG